VGKRMSPLSFLFPADAPERKKENVLLIGCTLQNFPNEEGRNRLI